MIIVVPFRGSATPQVPATKRYGNSSTVQLATPYEQWGQETIEAGRKAWHYIHTTDDKPEQALATFEPMVPSYGCDCKRDYSNMKEKYPPDFSSPENFGVWSWFIHNVVNQKLDKQFFTIEDYCEKYNRPLDVYLPLSRKYTSLPVIDQTNHAD